MKLQSNKYYIYNNEKTTNFLQSYKGLLGSKEKIVGWTTAHGNIKYLTKVRIITVFELTCNLTFYVPETDVSIFTNNDFFKNNFIPVSIDYNQYWAKLNE